MAIKQPKFSVQDLLEIFDYDPEAGLLHWKNCPRKGLGWNSRWPGMVAGTLSHGRRYVGIDYVKYANYHLIWFIETGEWPNPEIDHIDCNFSNDVFSNLRVATRTQNLRNRRKLMTNTSGLKWASWDKAREKWISSVSVGNKFKNLGRYDTAVEAHAVAAKFSNEIAAEFSRPE